jgi:hypothetical protein
MRVPDLEDLVTSQERAIRRQEQGADLLQEWQHVFNWLRTHDALLPIFTEWVTKAIARATSDPTKRAAMQSRLDQVYPREGLKEFSGDRYYDHTRLVSIVRRFVKQAGSA